MRRQSYVFVIQSVFFVCLILVAGVLAMHRSDAEAPEQPFQIGDICRGFVVLANGIAVLSGMPETLAPARMRVSHTARPAGVMAPNTSHGHREPMGQSSNAPLPLMGFTHGQEIVLQEDMLCVPIVDASPQRWTATSHPGAPTVTVESLQGALKSSSRVNATFALTIRQGDVPVEQAEVRLLARMPHHDRHMPGGHGPANDLAIQGIKAQPVRYGRYTISTVDFTMDGPWLFEVHIQRGAEIHKAYFAAYVGEE
jgi:hypothetical protein